MNELFCPMCATEAVDYFTKDDVEMYVHLETPLRVCIDADHEVNSELIYKTLVARGWHTCPHNAH